MREGTGEGLWIEDGISFVFPQNDLEQLETWTSVAIDKHRTLTSSKSLLKNGSGTARVVR